MVAGGSITLRLGVAGSAEVKAALAELGPAGARALKEIEAAQIGPTAGLRALSAASKDVTQSLEVLSGRLGPVGSGLAAIGPGGLAAAAGIAAVVAVGMKLTQAALNTGEWAESLRHFTEATGMSSKAVQEFDFIAKATGMPIEQMRAGLEGVTSVVGKLQDNLARGQRSPNVRLFEAILGTDDAASTDTKLRQLGDIEHILPVILDYVAKASPSERIGLDQVLKVDPTTMDRLIETRGQLADLRKEYNDLGIAIDDDMIKKSAEAAEKAHAASAIIDGEMRTAFINLAPAIAHVAENLVDATKDLIVFFNSFKGIQDRSTADLKIEQGDIQANMAQRRKWYPGIDTSPGPAKDMLRQTLDPMWGTNWQQQRDDAQKLAEIHARLGWGELGDTAGESGRIAGMLGGGGGGGGFKPPPLAGTGGRGGRDHSALSEDEAQKTYDEALLKAATDLAEEHRLRLAIIEDTRTAAVARANEAKGISPKARGGLLDAAGLTAGADTRAENERYAKAQADQVKAVDDRLRQLKDEQAKAEEQIGLTLARRQAVERDKLSTDQADAREKTEQLIRDQKLDKSDGGSLLALQLRLGQAASDDAQTKALTAKQSREQADALADTQRQSLEAQLDLLKAQLPLVHTMQQRRAIELQIFELEEKEREAAAEKAIGDAATPEAKALAQAQLDSARATAGMRRQGVSNANPPDPWSAELQKMSNQLPPINQEFGQIAADGLQKFNDGLIDASGRFQNLGTVVRQTLVQMLVQLEKYLIMQAEIGVFGNGQGGGGIAGILGGHTSTGDPNGAGGGSGGLLGSILSMFTHGGAMSAGAATPVGIGASDELAGLFAQGGATDRHHLRGYAGGGLPTGYLRGPGTATSDSFSIMASDREFVVNALATAKYRPVLEAMNHGQGPRGHFASGGGTDGQGGWGGAFGTHVTLHHTTHVHAEGADPATLQRVVDAQHAQAKQMPKLITEGLKVALKQR